MTRNLIGGPYDGCTTTTDSPFICRYLPPSDKPGVSQHSEPRLLAIYKQEPDGHYHYERTVREADLEKAE